MALETQNDIILAIIKPNTLQNASRLLLKNKYNFHKHYLYYSRERQNEKKYTYIYPLAV